VPLIIFKQITNIQNLTGIPLIYYFDELAQAIQVYPTPTMPSYSFTVWGRVANVNLGEFDTIPARIPPFMQNALTFELAYRLAAQYGVPWNPEKEKIREGLITSLKNKKAVDLSPGRNIVFGRPNSTSYAPFPYFYYMSGGGQ
jgi:hypothetical protein